MTALSTGLSTVMVADRVAPLREAKTVTVESTVTGADTIAKLTLVDPAAIRTDAGTAAAAGRFELRVTVAPPVGAAPFKPTVPTEPTPPVTEFGERARVKSTGAKTVTGAVLLTALRVAVTVALTLAATGVTATLKDAVVAPAATVTDDGTTTEA